jgi:hypothetical protein
VARIRTIKPEFPQSETMGKLSRDARLLFIMLWTICDDEGRARASSRMLASLLFPYDDDARALLPEWLIELDKAGVIRLYEVEGNSYLEIPKWLNHQKIDHKTPSRLPPFREDSRKLASQPETLAPHIKDLGPVPRTMDLGPTGADAPRETEPSSNDRRIKLPADWRPTDDDQHHAVDKGLDPETSLAAFADYFGEGRGRNEKRTLAGWSKRWRVWCNTDAERQPARRVSGVRPAGGGGEAGAFARAAARLGGS